MKPFNAPSVSLQAPDDWVDASTYVLIGPKVGDGRFTLVVSIARRVPDPDVSAHVSRQLPDIAKLPMFKLLAQNHTMMHGFETVILDYTWKQPAGPMLRQRQWYLYVKGDIYTLTATAHNRGV